MIRRSLAVAVVALIAALGLSACSTAKMNEHVYEETVPAALSQADPGVVESFAASGLDGFTNYVRIGIDLDRDELSPVQLGTMLGAITSAGGISSSQLRISVQDSHGDFFDVAEIARQIDPSRESSVNKTDLVIDADDARSLAEMTEDGEHV